MATVQVACPGRSLGPVNNVGKHQLPTTVMSLAASASAPVSSQWLPKLGGLGSCGGLRRMSRNSRLVDVL